MPCHAIPFHATPRNTMPCHSVTVTYLSSYTISTSTYQNITTAHSQCGSDIINCGVEPAISFPHDCPTLRTCRFFAALRLDGHQAVSSLGIQSLPVVLCQKSEAHLNVKPQNKMNKEALQIDSPLHNPLSTSCFLAVSSLWHIQLWLLEDSKTMLAGDWFKQLRQMCLAEIYLPCTAMYRSILGSLKCQQCVKVAATINVLNSVFYNFLPSPSNRLPLWHCGLRKPERTPQRSSCLRNVSAISPEDCSCTGSWKSPEHLLLWGCRQASVWPWSITREGGCLGVLSEITYSTAHTSTPFAVAVFRFQIDAEVDYANKYVSWLQSFRVSAGNGTTPEGLGVLRCYILYIYHTYIYIRQKLAASSQCVQHVLVLLHWNIANTYHWSTWFFKSIWCKMMQIGWSQEKAFSLNWACLKNGLTNRCFALHVHKPLKCSRHIAVQKNCFSSRQQKLQRLAMLDSCPDLIVTYFSALNGQWAGWLAITPCWS